MDRILIIFVLFITSCATVPESVWDDYPAEGVAAMRCVRDVAGITPVFTEVEVHLVDDGTCNGGIPYAKLWTVDAPPLSTPVKACYFLGDGRRIFIEEDALWHEKSIIVAHETVHLLLDNAGVPIAEHHYITGNCGLNGAQ